MNTFIYFFFLFIGILEAIWYFTCTDHKQFPLIFVILDIFVLFIPILNAVISLMDIFLLWGMVDNRVIKLKDNWFNRTFLAYGQ